MNNLPNDVLLEIFDYVKKGEVMPLAKVSKRWKNLIKNSSKLMKRSGITISPSTIDNLLKEDADLQHKNLTIQAHLLRDLEELILFVAKMKLFMKNFRDSVESFSLIYFQTYFFFKFVPPLHNLIELKLEMCNRLDTIDSLTQSVILPKLKILDVKYSTPLLEHLQVDNLEMFQVHDFGNEKVNFNVTRFLATCPKLQEIKFLGFVPNFYNINSFKFQLTSFTIYLNYDKNPSPESVIELIRRQKDTIKNITVVGFNTIDFVQFGINQMNLSKFEVDLSIINADYGLGDLNVNKSIKKMSVKVNNAAIRHMLNIIEVCQGVEDLLISSNSKIKMSNWLVKAASSMEGLRSLNLNSIFDILLPQFLNFEKLEILTVTRIGGDEELLGWIQLVSRCPNVKKLVVKKWGKIFSVVLKEMVRKKDPTILRKNNLKFILISLPELEEIEIHGNFHMTNEIIDVLVTCHTYSKLKKFIFESEITDDLLEKLKRTHDTKLQCILVKPPPVKTEKRKRPGGN